MCWKANIIDLKIFKYIIVKFEDIEYKKETLKNLKGDKPDHV